MEYCLTTEALCKTYRQGKALHNVTMHVPKGAIYGFVGKNGAGKTTLIRLICGLQAPTAGGYTLYGVRNTDPSIHRVRRRMGAVVESPAIYLDLTAEDNLRLQARLLGLPSEEGIAPLLELVGLGETGRKKARNFSLGMRQRLGIAVALCGEPDFLVLDEPTNDLDIITLQVLEEYLQNFKGCVIVVSHDRYFMDKVVDHLLVFKGQGDIRDFPGNYSDYRDWREAKEQREKEAEKPKEEKTARVRLNDKRKMSFKEKKEFEQLEQEIAGLEQEKADIEAALCSGTLGVEELTEKSKRLPELNDLIDEKTMRWLELSEIEG